MVYLGYLARGTNFLGATVSGPSKVTKVLAWLPWSHQGYHGHSDVTKVTATDYSSSVCP